MNIRMLSGYERICDRNSHSGILSGPHFEVFSQMIGSRIEVEACHR